MAAWGRGCTAMVRESCREVQCDLQAFLKYTEEERDVRAWTLHVQRHWARSSVCISLETSLALAPVSQGPPVSKGVS